MRPCVGAEEQQAGLGDFLCLQVKSQCVIPRETFVAAAVHACKPGPEQQAASTLVQVVEGVEMDAV